MTTPPTSGIDMLDALPGDEIPRVAPFVELGDSGLKRQSGYIDDEFLPQLKGRKAVKVFREISDNSSAIGGWYAAVTQLLRGITWEVEPGGSSAEDKKYAEHIEQCKDDMSHSWGDMITEIGSFTIYGWSASEICYKRREGPWYTNKANGNLHRSAYDDKLIGWRKIEGRSQESLLRWVQDEHGGALAMVQQAPPRYQRKVLPMQKLLHVRTTKAKNSPEGRSLLRNTYQPWYYLKRFQEIEAIGVSRDLAGMPIAKIPSKVLAADQTMPKEFAMKQAITRLVTQIYRNEKEGIVWPNDMDENGNKAYEFELLSAGGSRQFDTGGIIDRYKTEMLQALLADFLQVGHESNGGSYALHTDKTGLFRSSINALAEMIADAFNRQAIPELFRLNGWKPEKFPKIKPANVDPPALAELAQFMTAMGGLGMQWFPDPTADKFVRNIAGMPKLDEKIHDTLDDQQRYASLIAIAQQRLEAVQIDQQVEQGQMQMDQMRLQTQQAEMGHVQQAQQLAAGPEDPNAAAPQDPNEAKRGELAVQTDKVKLDQQKQKLKDMKKPATTRPAAKPVSKAWRDALGGPR